MALLSKVSAQGSLKSGLTVAGVQSNFQQMLAQGNNTGTSPAAQVASDAYMLYCHSVDIIPVEDLDADGPLHLKSINDPDFGAYDLVKARMAGGVLVDRTSLGGAAGKSGASEKANEVATAPAEAKTPVKLADERIMTPEGVDPRLSLSVVLATMGWTQQQP